MVESATRQQIVAAALRAADQLERADYRGWDPFDALASPLFGLPWLRSARLPRFAAQQAVRRLPVNLRPLLRVPRGRNPVTLALALQAYAHLHRVAAPADAERHRARAERCVAELGRMRSPGWSGDCWGYDFDWEARYTRIPAWTPTIVATGIVTNALFEGHRLLGLEDAFAMCASAVRFVLRDLERTPGPDATFCWSYSPLYRDTVLNATMKGARLCAQVHAVTGDPEPAAAATATVAYVASQQAESGAWPYAVGDARRWADNLHTGYVLECLDAYARCSGDTAFNETIRRGYAYYRSRFFTDRWDAKYFDDRVHPIDATACAQSIITLCRFGDTEAARRVAASTIALLQRADGAFGYQVRRLFTVRTPFARWSTAWMLAALAVLADAERSRANALAVAP
jgi:hypothetical protein